VVVPYAETYRRPVRKLLEAGQVRVNSLEWIVPTLEDVFISTIRVSEIGKEPK
jgi:hypothetical protein